jgi:hypothetical protein
MGRCCCATGTSGFGALKIVRFRHFDHKVHPNAHHHCSYIPDLPFILLGDAPASDPEIYRQIVHSFRVACGRSTSAT